MNYNCSCILWKGSIMFQDKFGSVFEFFLVLLTAPSILPHWLWFVFYLAVEKFFLSIIIICLLAKKKKILSPQKLFILILMLLLLYSFLSSLHRSCWILLRRPILKTTKEAVKNIATNFLNNITPQSMMACAHWTCCFLLCKYDRGILIGSLKCLIKLY